ncbi:Voltage-gated potassium channel beta-2 subunit [Reticulomyxa filosa]|uniref:Voltage-gated potassium channel beta-2 subunit n=1 Tax=Reticulomyxa filosa TaxID=46433 RepID=X6PEV2_RETFI|nr:Voltage-gated potassium channel beta-2 subunit [Reticulomyxa filosa]|eukprot:ETO37020.1 Voltage-gated potassium channel beta-2 subunit [Reticulomyxa filosa]
MFARRMYFCLFVCSFGLVKVRGKNRDLSEKLFFLLFWNGDAIEYIEAEYLPVFEEPYKIGTTVWSPLDGGILTGKYQKEVPKDSRIGSDRLAVWFQKEFERTIDEKLKKLPGLQKICERFNCGLADLALAWVLKNKNVSVCLLGASRPEQLEKNAAALTLARKLDKEAMEEIEKVLNNKPVRDFHLWGPFVSLE